MSPRHDPAAERMVLGAALLDGRTLDDITLRPTDFYLPAHEELYGILQSEHRAGHPTSPVAVANAIHGRGVRIEPTMLHEIMGEVTSAAVAPHYARIVAGLAQLRKIQQLATALDQIGTDGAWDESTEALNEARTALDELERNATHGDLRTFQDALEDAIHGWENPENIRAYPTGWTKLDDQLNGGWKESQVTVLGARPAVGKSLVATCAAVAAHHYGVGFFSLEMSETELVGRMVAAEKAIDLGRINGNHLNDDDWRKIISLRGEAPNWKMHLESKPKVTMAQIRTTLRSWQKRTPVKLVIIDYLQIVAPADRRDMRERQVARIAEDAKAIAKDFQCHVLLLAQVNRENTKREDKRPLVSDLRESGAIEANADNIILLHRDDDHEGEIQFIVGKNRHGETGTLDLAWRPHYASVNSMDPHPADYRFGR